MPVTSILNLEGVEESVDEGRAQYESSSVVQSNYQLLITETREG